jgi:hypothetical protein
LHAGRDQSWNGLVKRLDASRYDYLFVLVADGRRWFIPSDRVEGEIGVRLGGPKYAAFEVERGDPIQPARAENTPLQSASATTRGDVRAAKGAAL